MGMFYTFTHMHVLYTLVTLRGDVFRHLLAGVGVLNATSEMVANFLGHNCHCGERWRMMVRRLDRDELPKFRRRWASCHSTPARFVAANEEWLNSPMPIPPPCNCRKFAVNFCAA